MVNETVLGSAAIVAGCLFFCMGMYTVNSDHDSIGFNTKLYARGVSWTPQGLGGSELKGDRQQSPLFGIMWAVIFVSSGFVLPLYLFILGLADDYQPPRQDDLFNAISFFGAAFLTVSGWAPVFAIRAGNSAWVAASLLLLASVLALTAVGLYRPFLVEVWHISVFLGFPMEFATGWIATAAALGTSMAALSQDYGHDPEPTIEQSNRASYAPLIVASVLAILAAVLGAPVLPLPFVIALLYARQNFWHAGALVVGIVGVTLGVLHVASGVTVY